MAGIRTARRFASSARTRRDPPGALVRRGSGSPTAATRRPRPCWRRSRAGRRCPSCQAPGAGTTTRGRAPRGSSPIMMPGAATRCPAPLLRRPSPPPAPRSLPLLLVTPTARTSVATGPDRNLGDRPRSLVGIPLLPVAWAQGDRASALRHANRQSTVTVVCIHGWMRHSNRWVP
jgi:hypothetical protein